MTSLALVMNALPMLVAAMASDSSSPTAVAAAAASGYATPMIAVPSTPSDGCPNAAQVAEALRSRLPNATVPSDAHLWPGKREILRSVLEVAADGTLVRFSLVDARGDVQLRRSLPTSVEGKPFECIALSEALAAIAERYVNFTGYESQAVAPGTSLPPDDLNGAGAGSAGRGSGASPQVTPQVTGAGSGVRRQVLLYLGGGVRAAPRMPASGTNVDTNADVHGHVGVQMEVARLPARLSLTLSAGVGAPREASRSAAHASLQRFPVRVGAATEFRLGPGWLEAMAEGGPDLLRIAVRFRDSGEGTATTTRTDLQLLSNLDGALAYRFGVGPRIFVRILAGGGIALVRYEVTFAGVPDVLISTPRTYVSAALQTGIVFR